jgi:hypothetical protein
MHRNDVIPSSARILVYARSGTVMAHAKTQIPRRARDDSFRDENSILNRDRILAMLHGHDRRPRLKIGFLRRLVAGVRTVYTKLRKRRSPPADPYAYTMAPLRRGPKGRSGSAVAETEDDSY